MSGEKKKISMAEICHDLAESLVKRFNFKTIPGKKEDEIWVYVNGIYKANGKHVIKNEVEKHLGKVCKTHYVNEIINKISRKTYIYREKFKCDDINLICCKNGVLNINTKELMPHSPDYNFTHMVPVNYKKDATCNKILQFVNEILYDEDIPVIQEWMGYCLYRSYFIKKGMILIGGGDTGKTTMLNLLIKFMGEENVSGVSLQAIANDKFSTSNLYNKHLNAYDDLSATDLQDTGKFKMVTGGGWINGERKFGDSFQFKNFAKLIFSTNKIPKTKNDDDDTAYYKRWIVLVFDNVFDNANKETNKTIIDDITDDDELSGMLNWAIDGLKRVLKNQQFSYNKDLSEIKNLMDRNSSDISKFVQDCFTKGDYKDWLSKDEMFEHYAEYCELNDFTINSKEMLGRKLPNLCNWLFEGRAGQSTGWRGVKIKDIKPISGVNI